MKKVLRLCFVFCCTPIIIGVISVHAFSQAAGIISTNPLAEQIMLGNYNPSTYLASTILNRPDTISRGILKRVSPDTLKKYLEILSTFNNRNTCSDTVSSTKGIGAARRWVHQKFQEYSAANENRLLVSYLQFNQMLCTYNQYKNIFAVLPGMDTTDKSIIIIEGHIDSRCAGLNDTSCLAQGMEDNGSGTALVMELARVMSKYSYNHTIVFMATVGEEQGLYGAEAFADYCTSKQIKVKAVQNNDVIGGVICGQTSSPPSCSPSGSIDSAQVRLFSYGGFNSAHKQLARFIKLEYKEMILPFASVPMTLSIMSAEDRTGRGGDHIPFRQHSFVAMRFTSANEHGNANTASPTYTDRQHTSGDVLGVDTDGDLVLDSFFVDFNYLSRNAVINGNASAMIGIGPKVPDLAVASPSAGVIAVTITQQMQYLNYRIGVRTATNDWDSVYAFSGVLSDTLYVNPTLTYYVSVASVDSNGVESLFSKEISMQPDGIKEHENRNGIELLQNKPNPFDESTYISFTMQRTVKYKNAYVQIAGLSGKVIKQLPVALHEGMNEVLYEHGYGITGTYVYSLVIDGKRIDSKKMIFSN